MALHAFATSKHEIASRGPLDVHVLSEGDLDGPLREKFLKVLLDPQQQPLAPFKDEADVRRRMDITFGGIFYGIDPSARIVITGQGLLSDRVATNIEDAKSGAYVVPKGKGTFANLFSIVNHPGAQKGIMKPFVQEMLRMVNGVGLSIEATYTLSPMLRFAEFVEKLEEEFLIASGLQRIITGPLDAFKEKVLGAASIEVLQGLDEFRPLTKLAAYYNSNGTRTDDGKFKAHNNTVGLHAQIGALVENLCALGDPLRIRESLGFMMNLRYVAENMASNAARFVADGIIPCSNVIKTIASPDGQPGSSQTSSLIHV